MHLSKKPPRYRRGSAGFRVFALVALLGAGGGGWWYLNDLKQPTQEELDAKKNMGRSDVVAAMVPLRSALRAFKDDTGAYPTTDEGLAALVKAGKVKNEDLSDPYGYPYQYKGPEDPSSQGEAGEFRLFSSGEDGKPVTADDISSAEVAGGSGG